MIRSLVPSLILMFTGAALASPETFTRDVQVCDQSVELKITIDFDHLDESGKQLAQTLPESYFKQWPQIALMIDAPISTTATHLKLSFQKELGYPAHVAGDQMVISAEHAGRDEEETQGVFSHELTHFIQGYPQDAGSPGWFTEGVADLVRYKLHPESYWAKVMIKYTDKQRALGAYWQSSAFLLWMEQTYGKPVASMVSRSCSEGKYDASIWKRETGLTLDELVEAYGKSDWVAPGK
ncbi:basic secretory protein-like protein [Sulfuriroseicoccus oceanibius]|uniref:Uncharacterized protein n=1 Tax=Sulfuriroseicoccus oceanibius TaxID=2707525 RepID=A0A6B3LAV9_9BACT|nr:basic secretory protein-like protein [Sulfuriroseicoccus oceanibius]QQL46156.1 hypothetical protein G3M56_006130 [Sulfuriroseicoccus oceanibius]